MDSMSNAARICAHPLRNICTTSPRSCAGSKCVLTACGWVMTSLRASAVANILTRRMSMWDARQPFLGSVTSRNAQYSYPILTKRLFYESCTSPHCASMTQSPSTAWRARASLRYAIDREAQKRPPHDAALSLFSRRQSVEMAVPLKPGYKHERRQAGERAKHEKPGPSDGVRDISGAKRKDVAPERGERGQQ